MGSDSIELFDAAYSTRSPLFGTTPTRCVVDVEAVIERSSTIIDLGCGDGRDTLYLLGRGHRVCAIDQSEQGIAALERRARESDLYDRLSASVVSVEDWQAPDHPVDALIAITILDHIPLEAHESLFRKIEDSVRSGGYVALEMHSDRDPGKNGSSTVSEFSSAIRSWSHSNYLIERFSSAWRIVSYSDRLELDSDHGPIHTHGFCTIVAIRN
jgi:cyclopropane fatty-acyl-phospholipid synthase-like methyltransferase